MLKKQAAETLAKPLLFPSFLLTDGAYPQAKRRSPLFLMFLLVSRREFPFKISVLTDLKVLFKGLSRIKKGSKRDKKGVKGDVFKNIPFN